MIERTKFCIKSLKKRDQKEALESLLAVDGDWLVLGYGYVGQVGTPAKYLDAVVNWLKGSEKRRVHLYVGILPNPRETLDVGIQVAADKVAKEFSDLLKSELYSTGVTDRIWVYAALGLHCKFALCCKTQDDGQLIPLGGLFGSSNLTYSALEAPNRIELDLFIGEGDSLLDQYADAVDEILNSVEEIYDILEREDQGKVAAIGNEIRERIFYGPALHEAEAHAKEDDLNNRISYADQGMSDADRKARMQSDEELEISSWKPGRTS